MEMGDIMKFYSYLKNRRDNSYFVYEDNYFEDMDELKKSFFSILSHELMTPLNLMFSSLQIFENHYTNSDYLKDDNKTENCFQTLQNNCLRLYKQIRNIMDLTKIKNNYFDLELRRVNLVEVIQEIIKSTNGYLENIDREIIFYTDKKNIFVVCDRGCLERVILNLLSNAYKNTEAGGVVYLSLFSKKEKVIITVRDTGKGINKEEVDKIFRPFYRIDNSFTREYEGCGLGLAIVRELVNLHEGKINVESIYGKGSEFTVDLPKKVGEKTESIVYAVNDLMEQVKIEFSDLEPYVNR